MPARGTSSLFDDGDSLQCGGKMTDNLKLPSRAWLVVALLWVVAALNYLDRVMITTMRRSLMDAVPMTEAQFGLLTSVFLIVYAVLSPFAGFLADRFSRSKVIIGSLFVWSVVTWLTAHAKTFEQLIATRALMGISEACYVPAALALIVDYHRGRTRSLATGIHLTGISIGSGLSGLGGLLAERHDWTFPFNLFGIVGIVYCVVLWLGLRDAPEADTGTVAPPKVKFGEAIVSLFSKGSFYLMLLFWGLLSVAGWGVVGWMPTYLGEQFNLSQGKAGLSATAYLNTGIALGLLIGGFWADRWSRTNKRARILVPVIGLCIAAPGVLLAANSTVLALAIAGLVIYGLTRSFTDSNMMPILCMVSDQRYLATGFGVLNMFACLVGAATIYVGGALRDAHVDVGHVFRFAAGGLIVCAVLLFLVRTHREQTTS